MGSLNEVLLKVEQAATEQLPAKALQARILELLRPHVPFDGHVFALTDPKTRVSTAPHADVPMVPRERLPEVIRWRYLTTLNRVDTVLDKPATSLRSVTADPTESAVWNHVLRDVGVHDTAIVAFSDRYGVWGYLELWRLGHRFRDRELDILTALATPVTLGLRTAVAQTFLAADDDVPRIGPAVIVLGPGLEVEQQTDAAAATLLRLLPPTEPHAPIPAAAYNIGGALVAAEAGLGIGDPWSRVHLGGSRWATLRASRLGANIAVSIEASTPAERMDLFARAGGLSERETQVMSLLGIGLDTTTIASQLFLSEHTVNDHVKAVLAKTGSRTRQVLLARISATG